MSVRESLNTAWQQWQQQQDALNDLNRLLARRASQHPACRQLAQLESVGVKREM